MSDNIKLARRLSLLTHTHTHTHTHTALPVQKETSFLSLRTCTLHEGEESYHGVMDGQTL